MLKTIAGFSPCDVFTRLLAYRLTNVVHLKAEMRKKGKRSDVCLSRCVLDTLQLRDEELSKDMQESNWFSAPSALRVYGQYLNLDKDHNGMLSKDELARYENN